MGSKGSGIGFMVGGMVLFVLGLLLSATVIGMVCGLPMIVVGLPTAIFGGFRYRQFQLDQLKQSIKEGIMEGSKRNDS